jgi:D-amino-acid oxidase
MNPARITVVGAGVIGLSIASELADAGHRVTVIADLAAADSVSAIAGALWMPHESERSEAASRLLALSRDRFDDLAVDPATGVLLRTGTIVERIPDPDRSWVPMAHDAVELSLDELPAGATSGMRATLPIIHMPTYLAWLRASDTDRGVRFEERHVDNLDEFVDSADIVVVAAGLRGGELMGDDDTVYPVRGQVVRVANPGLTDWITDDDSPDGIIYVFPRLDDVVIGGTGDANEWDTTIDSATESSMLERAIRLVPELAGQPIVSRAVGLRPARATIRLEQVAGHPMPVIAAYGHGGAGVTYSWGTATRVRGMVDDIRGEQRVD